MTGRESAGDKGKRLVTEGRLIVQMVGNVEKPGLIVAECRGDSGDIYKLGWDPKAEEWRCTCPELRGACSHLHALRLVVIHE